MRKIIMSFGFCFLTLQFALTLPAFGRETRSGYLVDLACAAEKKADDWDWGEKHSTQCLKMPSCASSGYGLLTDDKQVLKFDANGNELARKLISSKQANKSQPTKWIVRVTGDETNKILKVKNLRVQTQAPK
jgi:hypothetical protein